MLRQRDFLDSAALTAPGQRNHLDPALVTPWLQRWAIINKEIGTGIHDVYAVFTHALGKFPFFFSAVCLTPNTQSLLSLRASSSLTLDVIKELVFLQAVA